MNVSLGERGQEFIDRIVKEGRYSSPSEVLREGLRLVEEREAKVFALRASLSESMARGGEISDEELDATLDAKGAELRRQGYGD